MPQVAMMVPVSYVGAQGGREVGHAQIDSRQPAGGRRIAASGQDAAADTAGQQQKVGRQRTLRRGRACKERLRNTGPAVRLMARQEVVPLLRVSHRSLKFQSIVSKYSGRQTNESLMTESEAEYDLHKARSITLPDEETNNHFWPRLPTNANTNKPQLVAATHGTGVLQNGLIDRGCRDGCKLVEDGVEKERIFYELQAN